MSQSSQLYREPILAGAIVGLLHGGKYSHGEVMSNPVRSRLLLDDSGAMIAASATERQTLLTVFRRNRIKCNQHQEQGQCIIRFEQPYDIRRIDALFEAWRERVAH